MRVRKRDCGAFQPMRSAAGAFALGASQLPPAPQRRIASSAAIVLRRHARGSPGAAGSLARQGLPVAWLGRRITISQD
jgi:hypothetical protein